MTVEVLDLSIPSAPHDACNAGGIVAIAFVDLHLQGGLGVPGIDANNREPSLVEFGPKPCRGRSCLKADASQLWRVSRDEASDRVRIGGDHSLPLDLARLIDDTHGGLLQGNVQSHIVLHCMCLHLCKAVSSGLDLCLES